MTGADGIMVYIAIGISSVLFVWASYLTIKFFSPENVVLSSKDLRELELKVHSDKILLLEKEDQIKKLSSRVMDPGVSEKYDDLLKESEKLKKDLAEKDLQLETKQDKLDDIKGELDKIKREKDTPKISEIDFENMKSELSFKEEELLKKITEIEKYKASSEKIELFKQKEAGMLSDLELLKSEIEIKDVELKSNYIELEKRNREITKLDIESAQQETAKKEIASLKEKLDNMRTELELKDADLQRQQSENDKVRAEIAAAREDNGVQYKEQLEKLGAQMYAKDEQMRVLGEELDKLKNEIMAAESLEGIEGLTADNINSLQEEILRIEQKAYENQGMLEHAEERIMDKLRVLDDKTKESVENIAMTAGSIEFEAFRKMVHLDDTERKYINQIDALKLENEDLKNQVGLK